MEINNQENDPSNEPKYWKLKFFYFNKSDKRLFISSKNFGPTLNLANPKAILFLLGIF